VTVAPGGAHTFQDSTSGTNTTTITVGTTIEWQWAFSGHSVTSDTNVWPSSGVLSTGSHFDVTFNNPGTFPYYCVIHGGPGGIGMHGTVIVNP
jgi:plastocyanin